MTDEEWTRWLAKTARELDLEVNRVSPRWRVIMVREHPRRIRTKRLELARGPNGKAGR